MRKFILSLIMHSVMRTLDVRKVFVFYVREMVSVSEFRISSMFL